MDNLNNSINKQLECVNAIQEFAKSNKVAQLDEMLKEIISYSEQKYENREFTSETQP